ncbi:unnamed protein product [Danaus chrysippus]|uniref:(African queen) hypothetical protein n=1 Tax=Danaus chrysippus TaxID=151541 RepID=A0A8J2VQ40_9NEOP|nr:unnamed protein product [Danaus chrysippus]
MCTVVAIEYDTCYSSGGSVQTDAVPGLTSVQWKPSQRHTYFCVSDELADSTTAARLCSMDVKYSPVGMFTLGETDIGSKHQVLALLIYCCGPCMQSGA